MSSEFPTSPSLKHELRTPLNHIIGFCEMLIEEATDQDAAARAELVPDLQRIHEAGRRLLGVINDLFDSSIPEAERLDQSRIHHEVRTPLNQIIGYTELLEEVAGESGDTAALPDLAKIRSASLMLLDLVIVNFDSTRFPVDASEHLDPDEPIKLLRRDEPPSGEGPLRVGNATSSTGVVLIADDDPTNREMLARRLRRLGHRVELAEDGRQVVEKVRAGSYDLLLLDLVMPRMDGYEVLNYLRNNPPARHLPIIVLSASDDTRKIAHSIELGAQDYLTKPFDPVLLQARIDSCLENKRLRDREADYLRTIQREKERSDDLLHVILPADIAAELKANGVVCPRRIENVAVLFADVAGFTHYCDSRDPETIHRDLQDLVKELEILTVSHRMEKIKTIGDAYLAAAGLLKVTDKPLLDCVRCGLAMIKSARALPAAWDLRVGIHVGPVVAGIVGRQKYQYDIWGDTVNVAARMQAEARPGRLCVSEENWRLLERDCRGSSLGVREIRGKGRIEVFEVEALKA